MIASQKHLVFVFAIVRYDVGVRLLRETIIKQH